MFLRISVVPGFGQLECYSSLAGIMLGSSKKPSSRGYLTTDPTCTKRMGFCTRLARAIARFVASPSTIGGRDQAW
jgi:hypothetical protein